MIRNIYKSWISTLSGIVFFIADLAYLFINENPDSSVLTVIAFIGFVLLFASDDQVKKIINIIAAK